jgi:hypothetical protein
MGLSEYLQMRRLEREADDIRSTLGKSARHTAASSQTAMNERDEDGNKVYRKVRGSKKPTLTDKEKRDLIRKAKKVEADLKKAKKQT